MSADSWAICPKCGGNIEAAWKRDKKEIDESYGKIPAAEYIQRVAALSPEPMSRETLREDYEMGILRGEFFVIYKGSCSQCSFVYEFKHSEQVKS